MDARIEKAAKLSTERIKESMPPSLLIQLQELGRCMSVSWLGIFAGLWIPIQYLMGYSKTEVEDTMWKEPIIVWPLIHSSSGTRKSAIHSFINALIKFENWDEEELLQNQIPQYTFTKQHSKIWGWS